MNKTKPRSNQTDFPREVFPVAGVESFWAEDKIMLDRCKAKLGNMPRDRSEPFPQLGNIFPDPGNSQTLL